MDYTLILVVFGCFLHATPTLRGAVNSIGSVTIHSSEPKNFELDINNGSFLLLLKVTSSHPVPRGASGTLPHSVFFQFASLMCTKFGLNFSIHSRVLDYFYLLSLPTPSLRGILSSKCCFFCFLGSK